MPLDSRFSSRAVSRVAVRKTDERANRRRIVLILAAASALALCAISMARAETWATVNPDGSVTRTETTASTEMTAQDNVRRLQDDSYPDDYEVQSTPRVASGRTTTIFSGTYYPLPPTYYAYPQPNYNIQPPGYTYPVGPVNPRVPSPTITNGPGVSSGPTYLLPYGYPYGYYVPQPQCPYPVYATPSYGMNGTYYSGPTGGGGTIYSSSTSQDNGTGLFLGNGGLNIQIGGSNRSTQSTTTVTTY